MECMQMHLPISLHDDDDDDDDDGQFQWTPLHFAAYGELDVAQLLVQSGAFIEAQDRVSGVGASEWNEMDFIFNG